MKDVKRFKAQSFIILDKVERQTQNSTFPSEAEIRIRHVIAMRKISLLNVVNMNVSKVTPCLKKVLVL